MRGRYENGDPSTPWLELLSEAAYMPTGVDPTEATPDLLRDWELCFGETDVRCGGMETAVYVGRLEMPAEWREVVSVEKECVVLVAGLGVCSQELGSETGDALSLLASRGLVLAAKVTARQKLPVTTRNRQAAYSQQHELPRAIKGRIVQPGAID